MPPPKRPRLGCSTGAATMSYTVRLCRLDQVQGHGLPMIPEADESDLHCSLSSFSSMK
jgi:hypothetical protein